VRGEEAEARLSPLIKVGRLKRSRVGRRSYAMKSIINMLMPRSGGVRKRMVTAPANGSNVGR
jgi:hypothetical protein